MDEVADRQLEAVLERLDRIAEQVAILNRRVDTESMARIAHELHVLNESLQAIVVAALGQPAAQVRRRV